MIPPSSMPIPYWFLREDVTINTFTEKAESGTGAPELDASTVYTAKGCLQQNTSSEGMLYQRETGNELFTLFLAPTTTAGASLAGLLGKTNQYVINSVTYRAGGSAMDPCLNGVVYQVSVYRET